MKDSGRNIAKRAAAYFFGLFIMTAGIAISVKSDLGVSPVSSIPYTITCVTGMEMGNATILFHAFLVLLQIILLRKKFKPYNILQIAVGIVFGKFTTVCNAIMAPLPTPENIAVRIIMVLISIVLIAIGIFFYLPANIMPLAGEGAMQAVSEITSIPFAKVKVGFDVSMVVISLVTCLILIGNVGSVGIGTIMAAILVGIVLGEITKRFGEKKESNSAA